MSDRYPRNHSGFLMVVIWFAFGQLAFKLPPNQPPFMEGNSNWADTTMQQLTLDEKIGQLFIVESRLPHGLSKSVQIHEKFQPGGILLKDISEKNYPNAIQDLRRVAKIPLFELSDVQTSINNQLSDLPDYPSNASLSAVNPNHAPRAIWKKLLVDFQKMGINCSLSPNIQSFSENRFNYKKQQQPEENLILLSEAAKRVEHLQKKNILAIANAFAIAPDSIPDSISLQNGFLSEYEPLIKSGLSGIFADDRVFEKDSMKQRQPDYFKNFLQKYLQFNGLVFGKLSKLVSVEELIYAGVSVIIVPEEELEQTIRSLKKMLKSGAMSEAVLASNVRKILMAKKWLGLDQKNYVRMASHTPFRSKDPQLEENYVRELFEQSIVLANNPDSLLPFTDTYTKEFKVVHVGQRRLRKFQNSLFNYANFSNHLYRPKENGNINGLAFNPIKNGAFIITLEDINLSPVKHKEFISSVNTLSQSSEVVLINFGNPLNFNLLDSNVVAIQIFECNQITEEFAAQLLFGAIQAKGSLPLEVASWIPQGTSLQTPLLRLKYTIPEEVGISSEKLVKIEKIFKSAIHQKATPGGQVVIAKSGKIIYSRVFGHHTYEKIQRVEKSDLYDVASVTKTAATTLAAMRLFEEKAIEMKKTLNDQMDLPKEATVKNILLKNLFIHRSGLQRNMPISTYLINRKRRGDNTAYFCRQQSDKYSLEIGKDFYMNPDYQDSIWLKVSQLPKPYLYRRYLYSDVNFYLIHQLIEEKSEMNLDDYLNKNFYQPLGLRYCTFNPLDRFPADIIVPTQDDKYWRKNLVRGYVHDEAAALMGGVGGNAGLFANAEDLAVLFQMILNGGFYGGQQFLKKETIDYFTAAIHGNHRGLGFDTARYNYTASKSASRNTFGHSGFSGTCVWVDPKEELIYVFLSNRIHPNPKNNQLKKMRIRQRIHQVIYDALLSSGSKAISVDMAGE